MFKEKLPDSGIITHLYLIYNLYIKSKIFKRRYTYSQWGEDIFIKNFFFNKANGKYLDIGCYHPIKYSNTALLYNKGWSGTNIDINPISIKLFNIARKRDKNICAAISDRRSQIRIFIDHFFSPINSLRTKAIEDTFLYRIGDKSFTFKFKKSLKVNTDSFSNLVNKNFDFLNIDIEGSEFDVLKQINFKKFRPRLIAIEIHGNLKLKKNIKVVKILVKNKYRFYKRYGPTCMFVKNL